MADVPTTLVVTLSCAVPDPATANLTFTSYSGGDATFTLSAAIPSTATTISVWSVTGWTDSGCTSSSGESDSQNANIVIAAGGTTDTKSGNTAMTATSARYKRGTSITVNGVSKADGETITIGGTTVTVVISSACTVYAA